MTSFAIDTSSIELLLFSSIRSIWSFGVVAGVISLSTYFFFGWYRRRGLILEEKNYITKVEQEERASEEATKIMLDAVLRAKAEVVQRLETAELAYYETRARLKEGPTDDVSAEELEERDHKAWIELLAAKQAVADLV